MTKCAGSEQTAELECSEEQEAAVENEGLLGRIRRGLQKDPSLMSFGATLGMSVEMVDRGEAIVSLRADERHGNVLGYTHGGALCTLADTAMGMAHLGTLGHGETATTVDIKVNFLRPAWLHQKLRAHAKQIKHGRTISLLECSIFDSENQLVAHASGTMMTLTDERTQGRHKYHFEKA